MPPEKLSVIIDLAPLPSLWCTDPAAISVGLQEGRDGVLRGQPIDNGIRFEVEIGVKGTGEAPDFAGPLVHGRKGGRFLYVTWGDDDGAGGHRCFRRLKLYLSPVSRRGWSSAGITWAQVRAGRRIGVRVSGRGPDNTPSCGTAETHWVAR